MATPVDIHLKNGQVVTTDMEDKEVSRLTEDFANFVTSDNPDNSGGVYNGNANSTTQSIFLSFASVEAVIVNGMAAK